jgi:hypothetical protein
MELTHLSGMEKVCNKCYNDKVIIKNSVFKVLNPRRRVYVEIPRPSRVELKCSQNPRC